MSVRIRYKRSSMNSELLQSVRTFVTTDLTKVYNVELDLTNKRFRIRNANDNSVVMEAGKTANTAVLKIQAKDALTALGVEFREELRDKYK